MAQSVLSEISKWVFLGEFRMKDELFSFHLKLTFLTIFEKSPSTVDVGSR